MRRTALLAILVLCAVPAFAKKAQDFFPPKVWSGFYYAGMGVSALEWVGEKPIWHGLEHGLVRQTRFVFTDGHPNKTRILHIRERDDGSGTLHVFSINEVPRKPKRIERRNIIKLDAASIATINRLAAESGTFDFEVGSWDDKEDIYVHCQTLQLERMDAGGYRYSSLNIGCNQPAKLMPLVEHVMALAGIKRRDPQLL
ncbi:MAG TPA: hypothetical protein PKA59_05770 [Chakrabartia sp.]|nr:hypothetical protein [Chakrabartia sp.]